MTLNKRFREIDVGLENIEGTLIGKGFEQETAARIRKLRCLLTCLEVECTGSSSAYEDLWRIPDSLRGEDSLDESK